MIVKYPPYYEMEISTKGIVRFYSYKKAYGKIYREKNKEKAAEYHKAWKQARKERIK